MLSLLAQAAAAASAVASATPVPEVTPFQDVGAAIAAASGAVGLYKTGQFAALALALTKIVWGILEYIPAIKKKLGKHGMGVNILLGAVAGALAMVVGGASWMEALAVLMMGPASDVIHDLLDAFWHYKRRVEAEANLAEKKANDG